MGSTYLPETFRVRKKETYTQRFVTPGWYSPSSGGCPGCSSWGKLALPIRLPLYGHWPLWVIWGPQFWLIIQKRSAPSLFPNLLVPYFQAVLEYRQKISLSWLVWLLPSGQVTRSFEEALLEAFVLAASEGSSPCPRALSVLTREESHR